MVPDGFGGCAVNNRHLDANRTNTESLLSEPDILTDLRSCLANDKYGMGLHIRDLATQAADELERLRRIEEAVKGMDLKCQVYGDQDLTCIEYDTDDFGKRMGGDELCEHCQLWDLIGASRE